MCYYKRRLLDDRRTQRAVGVMNVEDRRGFAGMSSERREQHAKRGEYSDLGFHVSNLS